MGELLSFSILGVQMVRAASTPFATAFSGLHRLRPKCVFLPIESKVCIQICAYIML